MKYVEALGCRECGQRYPVAAQHVCELCFGPLEVVYDLDAVAAAIDRGVVGAGPRSLWRYAPLLPAPEATRIDIGAGFTPLRAAPRLAAELGLRKLWLKYDGTNPTHSFKDRVVSVALSVARHFGYSVAACASTGNLANAVAAHAAASGMKSVVFIPRGLETGKVAGTTVFGGIVVEIDGSYDDVNRVCAELAGSKHWAFVNVNVRPYYAEGSKTLAFEIAEQLGWRVPDAIVVPVASGALLTKVAKGFRELNRVGLLSEEPHTTIFGAQAEGCSPVATAFREGSEDVRPVKPATIAKSLAIGNPADGYYALREVRATGGRVDSVPEADIAEGIELLARTEGIFTETAGGVTIAALQSLVRSGVISPEQETVALITGIGLKTVEVMEGRAATLQVSADLDEVASALEEVGS
jgi:threonine synthase